MSASLTLPASMDLTRGLYRNGSFRPLMAISLAECSTGSRFAGSLTISGFLHAQYGISSDLADSRCDFEAEHHLARDPPLHPAPPLSSAFQRRLSSVDQAKQMCLAALVQISA